MPKRRQNAGDLFRIDNLEQAKNLIADIEVLMDKLDKTKPENFAGADTTELEKFNKKYRELIELTNGRKKLIDGIYVNSRDAIRKQLKEINSFVQSMDVTIANQIELNRLVEEESEKRKLNSQALKEQTKLSDTIRKNTSDISRNSSDKVTSFKGLSDALLNKYRENEFRNISRYNTKLAQDIQNRIIEKYEKDGKLDEAHQEEIEDEISEALRNANFKDFGIKTQLLGVAADTLKSAADKLLSLAKLGITNQSNVYEQTFEGISVRTGMTRGQYYGAQSATNNILGSLGLHDNIRTSDVQKMWSTLTTQGINTDFSNEQERNKAIANAIDTVLTNKIVPYLDTSDAYYQQLSDRLPTFDKQMRGMNLAANNIIGSSVVITDYLQDMVTSLSPMAALAEQDLGVQYAKSLGVYEAMRAEGLSDYTIGQMLSTSESIYRDPYAALNSGSLDKQLAVAYSIMGGGDLTNVPYVYGNYNRAQNLITSITPNNNLTPLLAGAMGASSLPVMAQTELVRGGFTNLQKYFNQANNYANSLTGYGNIATSNYTNNVNQTNRTLQETTLENFMNNLAVVNEWMGHWTDILMVALNGIKGILIAKLAGGVLGKLGGLGSGVAGAGFLNSTLGYNLMGSGAALGISSPGLAAAAGGAGVLGGGAMTIKGGYDVYNDFKTGNVSSNTMLSGIGAGMGAVGAGMLLASNPFGWAALAIGGIALLGRSLNEAANNFEKAGKVVEDEFNQAAIQMQKDSMQKEEYLLNIKKSLSEEQDVEKARKDLIASGLLSEQDVEKARKANIDGLEALTNKYIESTQKLSDTEQVLLEDLKTRQIEDANAAGKSIKDWFEQTYKGSGGNTKENNETAKNLIMNMAQVLDTKGEANWSDSEKKFMERYRKNTREGRMDYNDLRWIIEGGGSWWGISDAIMDNTTALLTNTGFGAYANARNANIQGFNAIDPKMATYAAAIINSTGKDRQRAIQEGKSNGLTYNMFKDQFTQANIPQFRSGLNNVPYDNYPALLHEGEAVLTANTASELRALVNEYREANNQSVQFDTIIQNQTDILVERINALISVVKQDSNTTQLNNNTTRVNRAMATMRSTASF